MMSCDVFLMWLRALWNFVLEAGFIEILLRVILGCWLLLIAPGCSLFATDVGSGSTDNLSAHVTHLAITVPEIQVTFGWADGSWVFRNGNFAGLAAVAAVGVLVYLTVKLRKSS